MNHFCKLCIVMLFAFMILGIGCSSDTKTLSVLPSTIDFEDVYIGEYSEVEITLKNKYGDDLIIKAVNITGSPDFSISSIGTIPVSLLPNEEMTITIKFDPSTSGLIAGSLSILYGINDKEKIIPISGVGIACARIDFSETSFDFMKKTINKTHTHDFEISNIGTDNLELSNLSLTGAGANAYKVTPTSFTVVPGSKTTITITFEPTASMKYDAELVIVHNAVNENTPFSYNVTGEGRASDPQISLSQSSPWDFGRVVISRSKNQICEIENTGLDPLKITTAILQTSVEFCIDAIKDSNDQPINLPYDIAVGDKISIEIKFAPNTINTFNDTLTLVHNGTNEISPLIIPLVGDGIVLHGFDFNGDGYSDLLVGADYDSDGGAKAGCAFIFFGSSNPPSSIDASTANVKFVGGDAADGFGHFVSSIGDFNNDGYDDVIIGAHSDDDGGLDSGCAFIFFGSSNPSKTIDASNANVKLVGADPDDRFGIRVSEAGDFNKDGFDDVIVGAHQDDDGGLDAGCAFIFFGSTTPPSTIDASNADVKLVGGDPRDRFGVTVSSAGDFNNDGYSDVFVGADCDDDGGLDSGCAFIFFGSANPPSTIDVSASNVKLVGADPNDKFGYNVSEKRGDFNNDGYDDVIVGAHADDDGGTDSGCAFVFFGSANPPGTIDASVANIKFIGEDPGDGFGVRVSSTGDFNNDGFDDIIVGAYNDDDGGTSSGCAFIFFGSANPSASVDASLANVKLIGGDPNDRLGHFVCSGGDFNSDGLDDVIVGAYSDDDGGTDSGCAFVFYGNANPSKRIDASAADVKLVGADSGDRFGVSVGG